MAGPTPLDPELLLSHVSWVRPLARRLVFGDDDLAEDVLQEAWIRALENPPRSERALGAWLRTTVRNVAHHVRRAQRRRFEVERRAARGEHERTADSVERLEQQQQVVAAVLKLAEPYRSTVVSRYFDELTTREIAMRQGILEGTVRVRLKRALDQLRARLIRESGGAEAAWRVTLLPILELPLPPVPAPVAGTATSSTVTTTLVTGGLIMSGKKIFVLAAAVLLLSIAGTYLTVSQRTEKDDTLARRDDTSGVEGARGGGTASSAPPLPDELPLTPSSPPAAVLHGAVRFAEDGERVPHLELILALQDSSGDRNERARTDEDGSFRLESDTGFTVVSLEAAPGPVSLRHFEEPRLTVAPGTPAEIMIEVSRGGHVAGVVVDERGTPLSGVAVDVWCQSLAEVDGPTPSEPERQATTDAAGRFAVDAVGPSFVIRAQDAGKIATRRPNGAIRAGQVIDDLEIVLVPETELSGRAVDAGRVPVAGATVEVRSIISATGQEPTETSGVFLGPPAPHRTKTEEDGRFHFAGVAPLPHAVKVTAPGYRDWLERIETAGPMEIVLQSGARLEVRVVDAGGHPIPGARLRLIDWGGRMSRRSGETDADGRCVLAGLHPSETAVLLVHAEGFAVQAEQPIRLPAEDRQIVVLQPALAIAGVLVDGTGQPLPSVDVEIEGNRVVDFGGAMRPTPTWERLWGLHRTHTDEEGRFSFGSLYPGSFTLRAGDTDPAGMHVEVEVEAGNDDLVVEFDPSRLRPEKAVLLGTVRDARTGDPVRAFTVTPMTPGEGGSMFGQGKVFRDDDGRFEIPGLDPGPLAIIVSAVGYSEWTAERREYDRGAHELEIWLEPARSVRVRVLEEDGTPFSRGWLTFLDEDGRHLSMDTSPGARQSALPLGPDGEALAVGLPGKPLMLRVNHPTGTEAGTFDIDLTEPPTEVVEVVLGAPTEHTVHVMVCGSGEDLAIDVTKLGRREALARLERWIAQGKVWPIDRETQVTTIQGPNPITLGTLAVIDDGGYVYHSGGFRDRTPQAVIPLRLTPDYRTLFFTADGYAQLPLPLPEWDNLRERELQIVILGREGRD